MSLPVRIRERKAAGATALRRATLHFASLIAELRRRRVLRVATVYVAISTGVIYAADAIMPGQTGARQRRCVRRRAHGAR
jgi:hypothetical protein